MINTMPALTPIGSANTTFRAPDSLNSTSTFMTTQQSGSVQNAADYYLQKCTAILNEIIGRLYERITEPNKTEAEQAKADQQAEAAKEVKEAETKQQDQLQTQYALESAVVKEEKIPQKPVPKSK